VAQDANDEYYKGAFSGRKGPGPTYDNLKNQADAAQNAYMTAVDDDRQLDVQDGKKNVMLDSAIAQRTREIGSSINPLLEAINENDGFLARYQAFSELSDDPDGKYWIHPISIVKLMITLLFILVEIAPILFKMMTERGPYDDILDRIKHEVTVKQMQLKSDLNHEINTAVKIHTAKHNKKLNEEIQVNEEVIKTIAQAQQEIAIAAIVKWKQEQKEKMKHNNLHEMVNNNS
jgi:hypothetical protein